MNDENNHEQKSLVTLNQTESFMMRWEENKKLATTLLKSGFLPKHFTNAEQVMAVMLKGRELNLPPMEALQSLYIVNGKVGMEAKLMLALIRRSGQLESQNIKILNQDNIPELSVTVTLKRKGEEPCVTSFSIKEARQANLLGKDNWKMYPMEMCQWRALARNARITFPDVVSGMMLYDELDINTRIDQAGNAEIIEDTSDYNQINAALNKAIADRKWSTLKAWMELYKTDIDKLSDDRRESLRRGFTASINALSKVEMDLYKQDIAQGKETEDANNRPVESTTGENGDSKTIS